MSHAIVIFSWHGTQCLMYYIVCVLYSHQWMLSCFWSSTSSSWESRLLHLMSSLLSQKSPWIGLKLPVSWFISYVVHTYVSIQPTMQYFGLCSQHRMCMHTFNALLSFTQCSGCMVYGSMAAIILLYLSAKFCKLCVINIEFWTVPIFCVLSWLLDVSCWLAPQLLYMSCWRKNPDYSRLAVTTPSSSSSWMESLVCSRLRWTPRK